MPAFNRIVIVLLESATQAAVLGNAYFSELRAKGAFLSNCRCVADSAQANNVAMVAGDLLGFGNTPDAQGDPVFDAPGWAQWIGHEDTRPLAIDSVATRLADQGLTWGAYAEAFDPAYVIPYDADAYDPNPASRAAFPTGATYQSPNGVGFVRRQSPLLSFPALVPLSTETDPNTSNFAVAEQLWTDVKSGALPNFALYSPSTLHSGASGLEGAATFLQGFLTEDPVALFPPETLIVVTFSVALPFAQGPDAYKVYTLLIGDMITPGIEREEPYTHYSLLASVQENFGLAKLQRNDLCAPSYWFVKGA